MIEFFGTLCEQCQRDISRRNRKMVAIVFTCFTILLGVIPTVVLYMKGDEDFYEFFGLAVLMSIVAIIFWLPINVIRKPPQGVSTDILVQIDGDYVISSGYLGMQKKPIKKVKKVIDAGEWYYLVFKWSGINASFVCQKNLLTQGTLEEFEALFEGKIVRE